MQVATQIGERVVRGRRRGGVGTSRRCLFGEADGNKKRTRSVVDDLLAGGRQSQTGAETCERNRTKYYNRSTDTQYRTDPQDGLRDTKNCVLNTE